MLCYEMFYCVETSIKTQTLTRKLRQGEPMQEKS